MKTHDERLHAGGRGFLWFVGAQKLDGSPSTAAYGLGACQIRAIQNGLSC